jgi:hypothetical protein
MTPPGVAAGLIAAFSTHLISVTGTWTGVTPVGVPLVVPWVGLA